MSKTILPRLIGQKASAFDSQSFWDAMDLVKEEDILKPSHYPEFLRIPLDRFGEEAGEYKVYRATKRVLGQKRTIIVTFHQGFYERQLSTLHGRIDKVRREMEERFSHEESKERYRHREKALLREYRRILEEKRLGNLLRVKIKGKGKRRLSLEVDKRAFKKKIKRLSAVQEEALWAVWIKGL